MNAENFCYWLQGWLEIQNPAQINSYQLNEIRNHLDLSLNKPTKPQYQLKDNGNFPSGVIFPEIQGTQYCSNFSIIPHSC